MKKLLILITGSLAVVTAYGQGRVNFSNINVPEQVITTNNLGNTGVTASGGNNYFYGLYVGPLNTPEGSLTLNILATNTLTGRLNGGSPVPLAAPHADGSSYPLTFQIRGWSSVGGTILSYEAALIAQVSNPAILTGKSTLGFVTPTFSPITQSALFGTAAGQINGFVLTPSAVVPEPSSIALGLLGLGAIALFRRRK